MPTYVLDGITYTYTLGILTASVTGILGSVTTANILNDFTGSDGGTYIVTSIADYAGQLSTSLLFLTIPPNVTSIGSYTFDGCSNLSSITIPASVQTIGTSAFYQCISLATLIFDETSSTSNLQTIGDTTFTGTAITSITIPASVETIGVSAFGQCTALVSVTFDGTSGTSSLTTIETNAFAQCTALEIIVFRDTSSTSSLRTIGYQAFLQTIISSITIPASVENIGSSAFSYCTFLTSITIPASVQSIGTSAFNQCTALETVIFDETSSTSNLQTIGDTTFTGTAITSITIPTSVQSIGTGAFQGCIKLATVTFADTSSLITIGETAFEQNPITSIIIPANVTSIYDRAFAACSVLETVTFASTNTLLTIDDYAFEYCEGLLSITIPASVTNIGTGAFNDCKSLATIIWVDPAQTIFVGSGAFGTNTTGTVTYNQTYYFSSTNTNLPEGLNPSPGGPESIYGSQSTGYTIDYVFDTIVTFTDGTSVAVLDTTTVINGGTIATNANKSITQILSVVVAPTVTQIENFAGATSLRVVDFSDAINLVTIGADTFFECYALLTITIPASVQTIGDSAFLLASNLATVIFAGTSSLQTIGNNAFQATALTTIIIPATVRSIGENAFDGCLGLTSVTFARISQLQTIGTNAFQGTALTSIIIPATVTSIGQDAFVDCNSLTTIIWVDPRGFTTLGTGAFNTGILDNDPPLGSVTYYRTVDRNDLPDVLDPPGSEITDPQGGPELIYSYKYEIIYRGVSGIPDAPTNVVAVETGATTADVSFTASVSVIPVTSYTVTSLPASIVQTFDSSPTNPITVTVTGLAGGTEYTFTVVANNLAGSSEPSTASNHITTDRARATTSGIAAAGQTTIPVTDAEGLGFRVGDIISIVGGTNKETLTIDSFASIITTTALVNSYPDGSTLTQLTEPGVTEPGAPFNLVATAGDNDVEISFLVDDGGSPITDISYSLNGGLTFTSLGQTASPVTISGLINNRRYTFVLNATNGVGTGPASSPVTVTTLCFNKGTEILCLNEEGEEEYILIEHLKKGDFVKSFNHGYRKIDTILTKNMINIPSDRYSCMYKMEKTDTNGLTKDLIVTGGHSILVDDLGELKEANDELFDGNTPQIDGKYLLLSSVSKDFVKLENHDMYTWYHFILENDDEGDRRFGVWANGILSETASKNYFTQMIFE